MVLLLQMAAGDVRGAAAPEEKPERDERHQCRDLCGGERILHDAARTETAHVNRREQRDRRQRRRQTEPGVTPGVTVRVVGEESTHNFVGRQFIPQRKE